MNDRRRTVLGVAFMAVALVVGFAVYRRIDAASLVASVREYSDRWWLIPLYLVAYIVLDILFVPTQALSIAAVLLWGWMKGGTVELVSATVGALFPYLIARSTLRDWVRARLESRARIREALDRDSFTLLLLLRIVPILPYTALNYVAGLSPIRPQRYMLATFIGVVPSTYIFAYFVDTTVQGVIDPRQVALRILAAGALFAALIIATRLAAPHVSKRMSTARTAPPQDGADRD